MKTHEEACAYLKKTDLEHIRDALGLPPPNRLGTHDILVAVNKLRSELNHARSLLKASERARRLVRESARREFARECARTSEADASNTAMCLLEDVTRLGRREA